MYAPMSGFAMSSSRALLRPRCAGVLSGGAPRRAFTLSARSPPLAEWTTNPALREFVERSVKALAPARVHLCDGSAAERERLLNTLALSGAVVRAGVGEGGKWAGCGIARSTPSDVARVESRTFIACERAEDAGACGARASRAPRCRARASRAAARAPPRASTRRAQCPRLPAAGPLNNWREPSALRAELARKFAGASRGRTLYVLPFVMGPSVSSPFSMIGVQVTDSAYAAANMSIMARTGPSVLAALNGGAAFVPGLHSVGAPLAPGEQDVPWPQNSEDKCIAHFPEAREIMSYGSGYGGNALLGKKCLALRIASAVARDEGWLAEHMLILELTHEASGARKYICGAFPSACGKTNLAMLVPAAGVRGWRLRVVGDDIAWLRLGADGRLRAVNPEAGFFGVAPGTSEKTNAMALAAAATNSIFTNVASTLDGGEPWWEGLTPAPPAGGLLSWLKKEWHSAAADGGPAAHPNSRFTAPASQCPNLAPSWDDPDGVPIDAILFGGRRSDTQPLVLEADSWAHGVYMGATLASEQTHAAEGKPGELRFDPMAMRPFIGYDVSSYLAHWLSFAARSNKLPKIFSVNWFAKDRASGKFLWPGFGDNARVLEWVFSRCAADAGEPLPRGAAGAAADATPVGKVPAAGALNVDGLAGVSPDALRALTRVDRALWAAELAKHRAWLASLGPRLPKQLLDEHARLERRVAAAAAQ